jgi:hypothetical protein
MDSDPTNSQTVFSPLTPARGYLPSSKPIPYSPHSVHSRLGEKTVWASF